MLYNSTAAALLHKHYIIYTLTHTHTRVVSKKILSKSRSPEKIFLVLCLNIQNTHFTQKIKKIYRASSLKNRLFGLLSFKFIYF